MPLLEIENLSFSYRSVTLNEEPSQRASSQTILKNINLQVKQGELIAIQGPSGSGKSTLLALLAGFLQLQSGDIRLNKQSFSSLDDNQMSRLRNQNIGYVFQQFHLLPKLTVVENILLPGQYNSEASPIELRQRALSLAQYLGLEHRLDHHPNQLSGGQQQRVAIARALLHDPDLILADEPTGNLDSKSAENIMELLIDLNKKGKTILIITHSDDIAQRCGRIIQIKDGQITDSEIDHSLRPTPQHQSHQEGTEKNDQSQHLENLRKEIRTLFSPAIVRQSYHDLIQNKMRSFLTMIGIIVGVASVLSMITLGHFIKEKVLESYAAMGINTVMFMGHPNWNVKASDSTGVYFKSFHWENDILPLAKIFPDIDSMTPIIQSYRATLSYGGRTIDTDARPVGVNEKAFLISDRKLKMGRGLSPFHVENRNAVCVIGAEVAEKLFFPHSPIGQILNVQGNSTSYGCQVIGVLESISSNKGWSNPNLEVYLPYTLFQTLAENPWEAEINRVLIKLREGAEISQVGKSIQGYFNLRYGKSGRFRVHNDSVMIAQLQKFLSLFTIALGAIAMICLLVGGVGITNMMLASIAERFREIGLRKALGATHERIRQHILMESILLCGGAGVIGLLIGFAFCQLVVFITAQFASNITFQWRLDLWAFVTSFISICVVGVLSGLAPALRAQKLQILEALRAD
ncbi:MAG: hypothetical protein RJB66_446 [Pseudomonadota bacterium]|jgi:macrolide transport system ATP-binding/permease protein